MMKQTLRTLGTVAALFAGSAWGAAVNVNTADTQALIALPGIGQAKAAALIDYRRAHGPFESAAELKAVDGIGQATVDKLQGRVSVEVSGSQR